MADGEVPGFDASDALAFRAMRERISKTAVPVVKALSAEASDDEDRELARAAGHAIWTLGMALVGIYQELNEIKHELAEANELRRRAL